MLFSKKNNFSVDFHSHILPRMDDGATGLSVSLEQLSALTGQGIEHVVATPHFYLHKEGVDTFLQRRQNRAEQVVHAASVSKERMPGVSIGAEVYLEQGLLKMGGLERLRLANTWYVLFELPYVGVSEREVELLFNLCTRSGVRPLLAHLDRYVESLSDELVAELISLPDVAVQINNEAFAKRQSAKFALDIIREGVPVVLGSDTHNMTDRAPNFDLSNKYLATKLKGEEYRRFAELQLALFRGQI